VSFGKIIGILRYSEFVYAGAQIESSTITCRKVFAMIYFIDGSACPVTPHRNPALCEGVYDSEVSRGFRYLLPRVPDRVLYTDFTYQLLCSPICYSDFRREKFRSRTSRTFLRMTDSRRIIVIATGSPSYLTLCQLHSNVHSYRIKQMRAFHFGLHLTGWI